MILQKIFALSLLTLLVFQAATPAQQNSTDKQTKTTEEISTELKEKAIEHLKLLARDSQQFGLPENRVRVQVIVAGLLWEQDEENARAIFQNSLVELQNLLAEIVNLPEEPSTEEQSEIYTKKYTLSELRREYVLALAALDPKAALDALQTLKVPTSEEYDPLKEEGLELQLATAIVKKDPDKAYNLAKERLKEGVSYELLESLKNLHKADPELAAKLARDVLGKIKTAKIKVPSDNANTATANTAGAETPAAVKIELDFWQVISFLTTASELNRQAARSKDKKITPLLADAEMRELSELIAQSFLAQRNATPYLIGSALREITRYSPALAARIRQKIGAEMSQQLDQMSESTDYYTEKENKTADELAAEAEKAAPDARDSRFADAVWKAVSDGDPEKAKLISAKIKDKKSYQYVFEAIEQAVPLAKARQGDLAEVRKILADLKSEDEKITTLAELATTLATKGEKEPAKKLLAEATQFLPSRLRKTKQLDSFLRVVKAYSLAEPERAFVMLENGISQMNEFIEAGIMLDEFYDYGSMQKDELLYSSISRQALTNLNDSVELLKNLAKADFERTVNLSDKFNRPEIRTFVRLRVAQALLDPQAAEREKTEREQLESEHEH